MATSDGKFLRGKIAHLTYRVVNGQQVVSGQSTRKRNKKSVPSKKATTVFGRASNLAWEFRAATCWLYEKFNDGQLHNRMTGNTVLALRSALDETKTGFNLKQNTFSRLQGLDFNIKSSFKNYFFAHPLVDYAENNLVHIYLPEMNLQTEVVFPQDSSKCKILITCSQFDLEYGHHNDTDFREFMIEKTHQNTLSEPKFATFKTEPGCLCIIGISLQYYQKGYLLETIMNNKKFNPATILSAYITNGIVNKFAMKNWYKMTFKTGRQLMLPPPVPVQLLLKSPNDTAA